MESDGWDSLRSARKAQKKGRAEASPFSWNFGVLKKSKEREPLCTFLYFSLNQVVDNRELSLFTVEAVNWALRHLFLIFNKRQIRNVCGRFLVGV